MSGHNKWSTIKHAKEKNDLQNAKVFTKIGREIAVAVKLGGADPNSNPKLKNLISKAKSANMPNDNIQRVIKKASGELGAVNYDEIVYEGYGPAGSALIVSCLTDNKNRTASDVRHAFDKFGGNLGSTGCVSYLFDRKGVIFIEKGTGISDDDMMMLGLEANADDVEIYDDCFKVLTSPENFDQVRDYFKDNGIQTASEEITLVPQNYITIPDDKITSFRKLIAFLEDNDDVQDIYHNVDNADEE